MPEPKAPRRRFVAGQRARLRRADEQPATIAPVEAQPDAEHDLVEVPKAEETVPPPEVGPLPALDALPEPSARQPRAALWWRVAITALAVAAVVLEALLVWGQVSPRGSSGIDAARRAALNAAKTAAPVALSYNYLHLSEDFAKAEKVLTGPALTQYKQSETALRTTVPQSQTVLDTAYIDGGVEAAPSASQINLLLFMDQIVTHKSQKQPTLNPIRVRVTMVHRGGKWLIDSITRVT